MGRKDDATAINVMTTTRRRLKSEFFLACSGFTNSIKIRSHVPGHTARAYVRYVGYFLKRANGTRTLFYRVRVRVGLCWDKNLELLMVPGGCPYR